MNGDVLNSWKEIAAYMGRGVRTVQRWEQELGLPVRRPRGKERSAVIALKPDLDRWLQEIPQGTAAVAAAPTHRDPNTHLRTERLLKLTHQLVERSTRIQEVVRTTLALTSQLRDQQAERMRSHNAQSQQTAPTRTVELRIVAGGANPVSGSAKHVEAAKQASV